MSTQIDPITRSVVQHRLSSIVNEMGEAMLRTSYSQILNSSRDFSLAICDTQGRLIAQADHIPVHVGALPWATLAVEQRFSDVRPGDVILLNDPYHGGSHLPDLTAFVPVFDGGRRLLGVDSFHQFVLPFLLVQMLSPFWNVRGWQMEARHSRLDRVHFR